MKVNGVRNDKYFIASADWHDYVSIGDLMIDGGVKGTFNYGGYTRSRGERCWAEIPITFAEFFEDYNLASPRERQYGIWPLKPLMGECQVRFLKDKEIPDTDSLEWKIKMAIWGTYGKDGKGPLKYIHLKDAETDHLKKILLQRSCSNQVEDIILAILAKRKHEKK